MEMPAVGRVDRAAVLEALGDHEAAVEDRDREDDQRKEPEPGQRSSSGRQDHHRRQQVAQQVGARVAHEADAGGKPWRRKPSAAPGRGAASTPAAYRSSERAITRRSAAEIAQTPAASPSTPSMKLITLIIATMPITVRMSPTSTCPRQGAVDGPGVERRRGTGRVKSSTQTPAEDRDHGGAELPEQLRAAGEVEDVVEHPHQRRSPRRRQDRPGRGVPGQRTAPATSDAARGSPDRPAWASGTSCRLRSRGLVDGVDPPRRAAAIGNGTSKASASAKAARSASTESRRVQPLRSGSAGAVAVEPERECHQTPDWRLRSSRPAEQCASSRRETRSGRRSPGGPMVSRPEHFPRERLQLAAQPGRERDREALLAAADDLARQQRRHRPPQQPLLGEAPDLHRGRQAEREARRPPGRGTGTRGSSECAMLARSVLTSRSSTR